LYDGEARQDQTEVVMAGASEFLPVTIDHTLVKMDADLEFSHARGALEAINGRNYGIVTKPKV